MSIKAWGQIVGTQEFMATVHEGTVTIKKKRRMYVHVHMIKSMNHNSLGCKQPYIIQAEMLKVKVTHVHVSQVGLII